MRPDRHGSRLAAWALAAALLGVGVAGGMAADRLLSGRDRDRRGPPAPEEIAERLRNDLALDDAQTSAVLEVVSARQRALSKLFARIDPEAEAIRGEANGRIRALLEPAQQVRFDAHVVEVERRRAELRRRFAVSREEPAR